MLTRKQRELLVFINQRIESDGVSPSFDEMKEALGLKSKSGIHRLITALEERKFIRRLPHRARALEILRLPEDLRRIAGDVEVLKVESVELRAIPAWVGEMANLRSLAVGADFEDVYAYENLFIREIPASIGELGALRELRLQGLTNVEELPEGMKRLTGLEVLSVENCGMREVPGWLGEMRGLRELTLEMTGVEEMPEEMGRLTRLQSLSIRYMRRLHALPIQPS